MRLFKLATLASRNPYVAYTIAISAVVLATLIRFGIDAYIVLPAAFVTYYPAIILVAFFCGLGPAVLAVWLSGVIAWYVFLPPPYTFTLDKTQTTTLVLFFIVARNQCGNRRVAEQGNGANCDLRAICAQYSR